MIEFLGINDIDTKQALVNEIVDRISKSNLLPELERECDLSHYRDSLMGYAKYNNIMLYRDDKSLAMCIIMDQDLNPHIRGKGLVVLLTLADGEPNALKILMQNIKQFANFLQKDWLAIHHRVRDYEYRCKYYRLRKHG